MSMVSQEETLTYADGQCKAMDMPSVTTDPHTGVYVLINFKDVVGVDVAGPENNCFSDYGMTRFKELAKATSIMPLR